MPLKLVALAWGFAEATLFFVVPDVSVGWVALRRPRSAVGAWAASVAGALLGSAIMHRAVRAGWEPDPVFRSLPGTHAGDLQRVRAGVERDPARAFVTGSFSGLPVKFYVAAAAQHDLPLRTTLVLVIANRAPRIGIFALALGAGGLAARSMRQPSRALSLLLYVSGWSVFYAWYWLLRRDETPIPRTRTVPSEPGP